mgnify:CR=1 FL=1
MNNQKIIEHISNFLHSRGYMCQEGLIENLYLSLKSKPFLILDGTGGAERYSFVKLVCESIGITSKNGNFKLISPGGICDKFFNHMGNINNDGVFYPGEIFSFVIKAFRDPEKPYVLYIDDLNLVNPDEYLRYILRAMDTARTCKSGKLTSEPFFNPDVFKNDYEKETYGSITYPENLYVICSICKDETCHCVSSRIKERANIIELTSDSFKPLHGNQKKCDVLEDIGNDFLKSEFATVSHYDEKTADILNEINNILKQCGNEFGHNTANEIMLYVITNRKLKLLDEDEAFDNCISQRILTKIEGCEHKYKNILPLLFKQCVTKGVGDYYANSLKMYRALSYPDSRYKKSAGKIALITRIIEENGYCAF